MTPMQLAQSIKSAARDAGFDWCGICPAVAPPGLDRFHRWLESGYQGEMRYLEDRQQAYSHPRHVMEGARSLVVLAVHYEPAECVTNPTGFGKVARFAIGRRDYHDVIHEQLKNLKAFVQDLKPNARVRGVVDTAPLLEREFAVLSGLGWQGKNTLILNPKAGSWFFLAVLLVDFDLPADPPRTTDHCGTCRACLDACPTSAFVQPNVLDASRCISYLTIELRQPVPVELRPLMGDWVFGCDVCQEVCPWNRMAPATAIADFQPVTSLHPLDLCELFELSDRQFRERFRRTPLWRPRRRGLLRNAAIVLGNQRDPAAVDALVKGLHDPEPLVRGAAAWALHQIDDPRSREALARRLPLETDSVVRAEISGLPSADTRDRPGIA
jgi:epoxyqueuosine reductase